MGCSCAASNATARHFSERRVRKELASYRATGPATTTRGLLGLLANADRPPRTVLDIGSGIGALSFGLLGAGAGRAICVDVSAAALAVGAEEAERLGVADRIEWVAGDFVEIAATVPSADLVVLDRVVCCYPAYAPLLTQ